MKRFFCSLLLASTTVTFVARPTTAIEINNQNYCWVNIDATNDQDNFAILVSEADLDQILESLEVLEIDCSSNTIRKFWF